jgi:hypothetical protein
VACLKAVATKDLSASDKISFSAKTFAFAYVVKGFKADSSVKIPSWIVDSAS